MSKPHSPIVIRESQPDDITDIQRIYAHHVQNGTASFEEVAPDTEAMAVRRQAVLELGAPYIVAERDGVVHGYAYATGFRPRSAYRYTVENSIYVEPQATGMGIGSKLLSTLIERCTDLGYRQMIAVIGGSQNLASINLHKRHGFEPAGQLNATGYKFGAWVDTVIMQRALGPGDDSLPD